jgi:hypothetical protein
MLELTTISEKSLHPSDGMTWIQYCFPNITRPGTGFEVSVLAHVALRMLAAIFLASQ